MHIPGEPAGRWPYNRFSRLHLILIPLFFLFWQPLAAQTVSSPVYANRLFVKGVSASESGNDDKALTYFQQAEAAGMSDYKLFFNLGVTYYKLGQLDRAKREFLRIENSSKLFALSRFNLGLISHLQKDDDRALKYFLLAEKTASTTELRTLSRSAINRIYGYRLSSEKPGWTWLQIEAGYDTNIILASDTAANITSGREDFLLGLISYGEYYFSGNADEGLRLQWYASPERHIDLSEYDLDNAEAGIAATYLSHEWHHDVSLIHGQSFFADEKYQTVNRIDWLGERNIGGELRLALSAGYEDIDASNDYSFLSGNRKSAGVRLSQRSPDRWSARYSFEINDRRNDTGDADYSNNFSPVTNTIGAEKRFSFRGGILFSVGASISLSAYQGNDTRPDGRNGKRKDDLSSLRFGISRDMANGWTLGGELYLSKNDSNFSEFDYRQEAIKISLDRIFQF